MIDCWLSLRKALCSILNPQTSNIYFLVFLHSWYQSIWDVQLGVKQRNPVEMYEAVLSCYEFYLCLIVLCFHLSTLRLKHSLELLSGP